MGNSAGSTAAVFTLGTSISTDDLENIVDKLRHERNRSSTRKNYHTVWRLFNNFFIKLDRKPNSWEDRLTLFVGYLVESKRKPATVRSYISAIRAVLWENKIELSDDKSLLSSLTTACRYRCDEVKLCLPIQKEVLTTILAKIQYTYSEQGQMYLSILYSALFSTYYFGHPEWENWHKELIQFLQEMFILQETKRNLSSS